MSDERCGTCRWINMADSYICRLVLVPIERVHPDDTCHLTPSAWEAKEE